jgi:IS1 family transposase
MVEQTRTGVGYLEATLLPAHSDDVLELDELWSFVGNKKNKVWIWIALCRRTRQVVAWWYGKRDRHCCGCLWNRIPEDYRQARVYTDFYAAYARVVPNQQHCPGAKSEGQTNHVERLNLTLRQRVARFVRKTLSFSKKLRHHIYALRLFFVQHNRQAALKYLKPVGTSA